MSLALKHLPVGAVYAIWSGLGIVGITLIGVFYFKEIFGVWHLLGTAFILCGVIILSFVTQAE
jgi:small multidrug resistance pump